MDRFVQRAYVLTGPVERVQTTRATLELVPTEEFGLCLFIDNELQFATNDEYIYHEMLVHPALMATESRANICIIGGGDGLAAREVLKWRDVDRVELIDWDEDLLYRFTTGFSNLNKQSLLNQKLWQVPRDIRSVLQEQQRQFNAILVDLTDPNYKDKECVNLWDDVLRGIKKWLAPGGSIVMNAGGFYPWDIETLRWLCTRISSVFRGIEGYSIQAYKVFVPSFAREWCFFLICPSSNLPLTTNMPAVFPSNLRYFDANTWFLAHIWSKEFDGAIPVQAVNLNDYMPRL